MSDKRYCGFSLFFCWLWFRVARSKNEKCPRVVWISMTVGGRVSCYVPRFVIYSPIIKFKLHVKLYKKYLEQLKWKKLGIRRAT